MDFQALAEATSVKSILRYLQQHADGNEDDDFNHLDGSSSTRDHVTSLSAPSSSATSTYQYGSATDDVIMENAPLLSPIAEDELFMLATNFLLYIAMVLIITMVAKIYFPESLERVIQPSNPVTSTVSYKRVVTTSDMEDNTTKSRSASYYSSDEEDEECGEECVDQKEDSTFLEMESDYERKKNKKSFKSSDISKSKNNEDVSTTPSLLEELEFDQEEKSKEHVLKRLAFCILMLNATFVTWGLLQERMLTRRYPRFTGEYFQYSYALVFTNRFWTLVMASALMIHLKPKRSSSTVIYEYSFPSITNMLSSWCQYEALKFVSFPAVTLFKSFKLAPVMAMGKFLGNKQYPQYDYWVAFMIGIGITMFMSSTDDLKVGFGYNVYDQRTVATWTGIMLLGFFLFFDSFTSQWQSRMFQRHRDLSMVELMFATSAFSTLLSFITLVHSHELWPALEFVMNHSEIHLHFFLFSICSTMGQLLIYYTIKNFGAVVFTIIMTTRVVLSIAISCYLYDHKVTATGFFGLVLVVSAVGYRIKRKATGNQLVKWRGIDDTNATAYIHQIHEHLDM